MDVVFPDGMVARLVAVPRTYGWRVRESIADLMKIFECE